MKMIFTVPETKVHNFPDRKSFQIECALAPINLDNHLLCLAQKDIQDIKYIKEPEYGVLQINNLD